MFLLITCVAGLSHGLASCQWWLLGHLERQPGGQRDMPRRHNYASVQQAVQQAFQYSQAKERSNLSLSFHWEPFCSGVGQFRLSPAVPQEPQGFQGRSFQESKLLSSALLWNLIQMLLKVYHSQAEGFQSSQKCRASMAQVARVLGCSS